jgi:phosphohistidine phosphatase SixA
MFAIFLTHADAKQVTPPAFRALTEAGRGQVALVARHFLSVMDDVIPGLSTAELAIGEVLTSPSARCVESALLFADSLLKYMSTSDIRVRDRLREQRHGQLSEGDLVSVLDDTTSPVVLACTHGDLAGALPANVAIKSEFNDRGWFKNARPVLAVVQYDRGSAWSDARLLMCDAISNGKVNSLSDMAAD